MEQQKKPEFCERSDTNYLTMATKNKTLYLYQKNMLPEEKIILTDNNVLKPFT